MYVQRQRDPDRPEPAAATAHADARRALAAGARSVVLVEGKSDRIALETIAARQGRDLAAEGVAIVAVGGAHGVDRFLDIFGPAGANVRLAGLCDVGEERHFARGLERAGLGAALTRDGMEALGFFVCVRDLEEELIRAVGDSAVERVIAAQGDLTSFRTYQKQPAHRERGFHDQLHGFMWNRKQRYARALVEALDARAVPRPLAGVLAHV